MKILTIIGLSLNFIGAIVLAFGLVKTKEQIRMESGTYYEENPHLKSSMYRDRKSAIIGIGVMAIGFLISLASELIK
ncbi:MAG: hypothetical protein ABIB97_03480 [Patescibacteria group bacterium]